MRDFVLVMVVLLVLDLIFKFALLITSGDGWEAAVRFFWLVVTFLLLCWGIGLLRSGA